MEDFYVFGRYFREINEEMFIYMRKNISSIKERLYSQKLDDIISVLERVGKIFLDENSYYYKIAYNDLIKNIKFSKPMIKQTLAIVPNILSRKVLEKRLSMELFYPYALDNILDRYNYDGYIRAYPYGVVFHVGAGNVFIGILDSLVMGIITKNVNIVKVSSKGSNFMNIFLEALNEVDKDKIISNSIAVLKWKGGESWIEENILKMSDLVMVWGGYDVSEYYKKNTSFNVEVKIFGPKTSFGILFEDYLKKNGYENIARKIVKDVSMWDQAACSNMHDLYIVCNKNTDKVVLKLMKELKKAFDEFIKKTPPGEIEPDEMVEMLKARELARVDVSLSKAKLIFDKNNYTIIYEKNPSYKLSPLNRTLYIKVVKDLNEIRKNILPYKDYLQTVGIGGDFKQKKLIMNLFFDTGALRFCDIGKMTEGVDGSPHDGRFVLSNLVRWVGLEGKATSEDKIVELVNFAKENSEFYKNFYSKFEVKDFKDFKKLPLLNKEHLLENTPPSNFSMFSSKPKRGIYFASGGSTGRPKYVFYDQHEYEHVIRMLAHAYEAGGLCDGDVVANLFVGGNLWSSFLSVEKAIAYTKAVSVPIGSSLPLDIIVNYLKEFKVNTIVGLPSFLIKISDYVKTNNIKLDIKKIFYGGEYITDEMVLFWKDVFGDDCIVKSGGYASADAGVIGFQCSYLEKGFHHLFDKSQYMEIIDPNTLREVKIGQIGEIVITPLGKKKMPLIRYRIGDLGRWVLNKCRCGRKEPVFEIVGRCDDRIHAGGAHIFVWDIQKAISYFKNLSFNFQIIIDKEKTKDRIEIIIESDEKPSKELISKIQEKILQNCHDLADSVKMGWIDPPIIRIVSPDTIKRIERTGKIKRVIDKRIKI